MFSLPAGRSIDVAAQRRPDPQYMGRKLSLAAPVNGHERGLSDG